MTDKITSKALSLQMKQMARTLTRSITAMKTDVVAATTKNTEDISANGDKINTHGRDLDEAREERRKMKDSIQELKREMADQRRGRSRTIVVLQGEGVPDRQPEENIFEVAKDIIQKLSAQVIDKNEVKNCHRSGLNGSIILVDFLFLGEGSTLWKILGGRDFASSKTHKVWINLHQSQYDRGLLFLARKLVKAGELEKAFVNNNSTTVAVKFGKKHLVMKEDDLKKLTSIDLETLKNAKK
jgi:hypothetical protein